MVKNNVFMKYQKHIVLGVMAFMFAMGILATNVSAMTYNVSSHNELKAALSNKSTRKVNIIRDFTINSHIVSNNTGNIEIEGNNNTVNFARYYIKNAYKAANMKVTNLNIKTTTTALKAFYSPCGSTIEFENINFEGGNILHRGCGSTATFKNVEFKGKTMNDDKTGTTNIKGDVKATTSASFIESKNIYFASDSNTDVLSNTAIFKVYSKGSVNFASGANAKLNSKQYGMAACNGSNVKINVQNGADVEMNTQTTFNGHTTAVDSIYVGDGAKLNISNAGSPYKKGTLKVRNRIDIDNNGTLLVINKDPKIRCHAAGSIGTLVMEASKSVINVGENAEFGVSHNQGQEAIYSNCGTTINFKNAKVEGWRQGSNLAGAATHSWSGLTGSIIIQKCNRGMSGRTNNNDFDQNWGRGIKYSQIWINKGAGTEQKPVISVDKNEITYERATVKTEAGFLSDIGARSTYTATSITSDFNSKVNMDVDGEYIVTLNQRTITGKEADPVQVKVIIKDTIAPIIYSKNIEIYDTAGKNVTKTEAEFLADIQARTDDGSPITSNFNDSILNDIGSHKIELRAEDQAGNSSTKKVVTIVVHENKTIIGNKAVLSADSFRLTITQARGLTIDEAKSDIYGKVSAFDVEDIAGNVTIGDDITSQVTVDADELDKINKSRITGQLPLTFILTYKGETIRKTVDVAVIP